MTSRVEKTITVDVPISTAYNQWTQFEEFPQFMGGVSQVQQLDDQRLHWVAEIDGVKREWYANILEQRPDEKIAWAATEGATNAGAVYFSSLGPGQTQVTLELEYEPEGLVEKVGDALNFVDRQAKADLERFKTYIESRGAESGAWRGDVEGQTIGTPGVESATSHGDSGKAGISGKAAAAGVAAAAVGVAAAAAVRSGGSDTQETDYVADETVTPTVGLAEETVYSETAPTDSAIIIDSDAPLAGAGDEVLPGGDQMDATTPGITDANDGDMNKTEDRI